MDEFLKARITVETRVDQVFRSQAIDLKIGALFDRLGHTCQMEHPVDTPYRLFQRGSVITIAMNEFDGKTFQPPQIAGISNQTAYAHSFSNQRLCHMAPDKSRASRDQGFQ